jgi:hypothetical protein
MTTIVQTDKSNVADKTKKTPKIHTVLDQTVQENIGSQGVYNILLDFLNSDRKLTQYEEEEFLRTSGFAVSRFADDTIIRLEYQGKNHFFFKPNGHYKRWPG